MKNSKKALTMVELMVSVALLAFIFAQVFEAFGLGNRIWDANSNQLIRQQQARNIASYLAKDIRALTDNFATSQLDVDGDLVTLKTGSGDIVYLLDIDGNDRFLKRAGTVVASNVQSVNLTSLSNYVEVDIITTTTSVIGGASNYQLKTKVRRRNET